MLVFGGLDGEERVLDEAVALDVEAVLGEASETAVEVHALNTSSLRREYLRRSQGAGASPAAGSLDCAPCGLYSLQAHVRTSGVNAGEILLAGDHLSQFSNRNELLLFGFSAQTNRIENVYRVPLHADASGSYDDDRNTLFLFCNHGSFLAPAKAGVTGESLQVLGGGGNCFSFGTRLNEGVLTVDLGAFEEEGGGA